MTVQSRKLATCIAREIEKQAAIKKPNGRSGCHDTDPNRTDTERIELPTPDAYAQAYARRLGLALLACDGLDESTLEILSRKDAKGRTNLQLLMRKVTWT